jgi:hypothetical protein
MQDWSGPISLRRSGPISRRDVLRYAATASALAGLGAASAAAGIPTAAAAAPTLIDFAMRQIPAQDIRAAGHSGVINYVSLSRPGSSFGAKPITRSYADSLTAAGLAIVSNYQPGNCTPRQAAARVHQSSSPSTTTSTGTPGTTLRCSGFAESTRCSACSAPASTGASMRASGPPPMVSLGIHARPASGGPGRPGRGRTVRSIPAQFSTNEL